MIQQMAKKIKIITTPLPNLNFPQRLFLKSFLFCTEHLIQPENLNNQSISNDPVIFVFNHNCSFEAVLVPAYLTFLRQGRSISFISDWIYGHIPGLKWIFEQTEPIYVYNKPSTIKHLNHYRRSHQIELSVYQECLTRLAQGRSIGIFPEGTRNSDPHFLLQGRRGIGYIALHSTVPVLPIGIDFPSRLSKGRLSKLGPFILRPGIKMNFRQERELFQQISSTADLDPTSKKKILNYLSAQLTFQIMNELSKLSGKEYPFQEPERPVLLERFLFNQVLTGQKNQNKEENKNVSGSNIQNS